MPDFIYPLVAVVINFICLLMCLKFIFSKRGAVWIVPVFLSLIFLAGSGLCLLAEVSPRADASILAFAQALSLYFLGAAVIWLVIITVFRAALNPGDIQSVKSRRNKAEADFLKDKTAPRSFWTGGDDNATFYHKKATVSKEHIAKIDEKPPKKKVVKRPEVDLYEEVRTLSPKRIKNEE